MFLTFVAIVVGVMGLATYDYRHTIKKNEQVPVHVQADPVLKAKGINLPGYNH